MKPILMTLAVMVTLGLLTSFSNSYAQGDELLCSENLFEVHRITLTRHSWNGAGDPTRNTVDLKDCSFLSRYVEDVSEASVRGCSDCSTLQAGADELVLNLLTRQGGIVDLGTRAELADRIGVGPWQAFAKLKLYEPWDVFNDPVANEVMAFPQTRAPLEVGHVYVIRSQRADLDSDLVQKLLVTEIVKDNADNVIRVEILLVPIRSEDTAEGTSMVRDSIRVLETRRPTPN